MATKRECASPDPAALEQAQALVRARIERYLERSPYRLCPDQVAVRYLVASLARNLLQHGRQYCPCRPVTGNRDADRPNICPCRTHHQEIARDGRCECGLFVSPEYAERVASGG